MVRKILIALNILALLGCFYWLYEERKPEPFVAVILSIVNIVGLTQEDKINRNIFKSNQFNTITGGNNSVAKSIKRQINNFASDNQKIRPSSQTNRIPTEETMFDGGLASHQPIKENPVDSVKVIINGVMAVVGDGYKTEECYFSVDGGATAKFKNQIVAGDKLFWNGSIAGYQLNRSDDLRFDYLTS